MMKNQTKKEEFLSRLKKTDQNGVYKDPVSGALVIRSTKKEQMLSDTIKRVSKLESKVDEINNNIGQMLKILKEKNK